MVIREIMWITNYILMFVMRPTFLMDTCIITDIDNWQKKTAVGVEMPTDAHCVSVLYLKGRAGSSYSIF